MSRVERCVSRETNTQIRVILYLTCTISMNTLIIDHEQLASFLRNSAIQYAVATCYYTNFTLNFFLFSTIKDKSVKTIRRPWLFMLKLFFFKD